MPVKILIDSIDNEANSPQKLLDLSAVGVNIG